MTYVIAEPCVDVMDRACVEECPVEAIFYEDDLPVEWVPYPTENAAFFEEPLPGQVSALGSPGGARKVGRLGVDTPMVTSLPTRPSGPPPRAVSGDMRTRTKLPPPNRVTPTRRPVG